MRGWPDLLQRKDPITKHKYTLHQRRDARQELRRALEDWVCVLAVHVHLGHHPKRDPKPVGHILFDVRLAARLLPAELVGRKRQDFEAKGAVLVVEGLQAFVVLFGEAARGGHVDDEHDLAGEVRKVDVVAVDVVGVLHRGAGVVYNERIWSVVKG